MSSFLIKLTEFFHVLMSALIRSSISPTTPISHNISRRQFLKSTIQPSLRHNVHRTKKQKTSACADTGKLSAPACKTFEDIRMQIVKNGIPLDGLIPERIKSSHHVLKEGDDVWDAKLNLSNSGDNNNKFYFIQLLEADHGNSSYYVWTRWGRVGFDGQHQLEGPVTKYEAKRFFTDKFKSKTGSLWESKDNLKRIPKKYFYLKGTYDFQGAESVDAVVLKESSISKTAAAVPLACKLHPRLQELVKIVCNVDDMVKQMAEIGYDTKKLPLGKLAQSTIQHGRRLLHEIMDSIRAGVSGQGQANIVALSDEFYTVIPHNFGFKKMRDFVLKNEDAVRSKLEMLDSLEEVTFAMRLLANAEDEKVDPVTSSYHKLACELNHLEESNQVVDLIKRYVATTTGHTAGHTHYCLEVEDVFEVRRQGEEERFAKGLGGMLGNHTLLWHGSRLTNWVGILSKGLLIAPPEAPTSGYMFGKGIYFADMVTKSANYCFVSRERNTGILVLSEVALGEVNELVSSDYDAAAKLQLKTSTKGVGRTSPSKVEKLPDGRWEGKPERARKRVVADQIH